VKRIEDKQFIEEFKQQWNTLWRNRLDDKVRAEGVSNDDYGLLFIQKGTVIIATRKFKMLDYYEILQQHKSLKNTGEIPPNPSVGGWGKFIKKVITPSTPLRRRQTHLKPDNPKGQQLKKSGRGWLHFRG